MQQLQDLASLESRVLAIFERQRQTPGAPYDASHFLDFLLPEPKRKSAVHDSFAGKRRFQRFVDDLQLELCVCLTNEDLERAWSPRALAERILHKQGNPRADLRLVARRSTAERAAWAVPTLFLNLLVGATAAGYRGADPLLAGRHRRRVGARAPERRLVDPAAARAAALAPSGGSPARGLCT